MSSISPSTGMASAPGDFLSLQLDRAETGFRRAKTQLLQLELERLRAKLVARIIVVNEWRRATRWLESGFQDLNAFCEIIHKAKDPAEVYSVLDCALRQRLRAVGNRAQVR